KKDCINQKESKNVGDVIFPMDVDGSTVVPVFTVGVPVAGGEPIIPELRLEHETVVVVG
ncbi:hypothetical protein Bca52824_095115, partial [Brassica carinata]